MEIVLTFYWTIIKFRLEIVKYKEIWQKFRVGSILSGIFLLVHNQIIVNLWKYDNKFHISDFRYVQSIGIWKCPWLSHDGSKQFC